MANLAPDALGLQDMIEKMVRRAVGDAKNIVLNISAAHERRMDVLEKRLEKCEYDSEREVLRRRVSELERILSSNGIDHAPQS